MEPNDQNQNTPNLPDDAVIEFVADGAKRSLPWKEVKETLLPKAYSADTRFREAAEMRKAIDADKAKWEAAQKLADVVEKARSNDTAAYRSLMVDHLGYDAATIDAAIAELENAGHEAPATETRPNGRDITGPIPMSHLPPAVRKFFEDCEKQGIDPAAAMSNMTKFQQFSVTERAQDLVRSTLDKHHILGKMIKDAARGKSIVDDIYDRTTRRVRSGDPFTVETIEKAMQEFLGPIEVFQSVTGAPAYNGFSPDRIGNVPKSPVGARLQPPTKPDPADKKYAGDKGRYYDDLKDYLNYKQESGG